MAIGVNEVRLLGNVGKPVEIRYTGAGAAVAVVNLATNEYYKDKATGQRKEHTEWHRVKLFGKTAEVANEYLQVGDTVYFQGKNSTRRWTDKDSAQERYSHEVVCTFMRLLGSKRPAEGDSVGDEGPAAPQGPMEDDEIQF